MKILLLMIFLYTCGVWAEPLPEDTGDYLIQLEQSKASSENAEPTPAPTPEPTATPLQTPTPAPAPLATPPLLKTQQPSTQRQLGPSRVVRRVVKVPQSYGYYGGLSYNQVKVDLTNSTRLPMSGMSFNLGAFYERALTSKIQLLTRGGYEGVTAKGMLASNACGSDCKMDIGYLNADALIKYSFYEKNKTWWAGGGIGFLFPLMKSSNVLDTSKMTLSERVILSGGVNWYRSRSTYVPLQIDYALQSSSSSVSVQQFVIRVGYGWSI